MPKVIRTIDLFSGCGGLSLGFELFRGDIEYQVVMALDIASSPIRCLNANQPEHNRIFPTGRVCDLTWFAHEAEVLLYYLVHYSQWLPDPELWDGLCSEMIDLPRFLASIKQADEWYSDAIQSLVQLPSFAGEVDKIDSGAFSSAVVKGFFGRLGISRPIGRNRFDRAEQPWLEEWESLPLDDASKPLNAPRALAATFTAELGALWDREVERIRESSTKKAKGLNANVIARIKPLVTFLDSDAGSDLRSTWLEWRTRRDTLRAAYSNEHHSALRELYSQRRVNLVLGGPPCKGFSRIARPIITSLSDQGTYSWASYDFGDERNTLMDRYVLVLSALTPDAFLFENVENFTSPLTTKSSAVFDPAANLAAAIESLADNSIHFNVRSSVVKASNYGVPQDRLRFIMVGINAEASDDDTLDLFFQHSSADTSLPLSVALAGLEAPGEFVFGQSGVGTDHRVRAYTLIDPTMPENMRRYIQWVRQPCPHDSCESSLVDAHVVRRPRADDLALIRKFAPGQRWMDYTLRRSKTLSQLQQLLDELANYVEQHPNDNLPSHKHIEDLRSRVDANLLLRLLIEDLELPIDFGGENHLLTGNYLSRGVQRHGDWFERLDAGSSCKTIVAHIGKDTYGYIHPFEDRAISIREAARIQSFPDFFEFGTEGVVEGYSMIGNAVPPLLAHHFAERFAGINSRREIFGGGRRSGNHKPKKRRIKQPVLFE